jgi:hypothetical protein
LNGSDSSSDNLIQQIRAGGSRELQVLAAEGLVPLPPPELIPLQVWLASSDDETVAETAMNSLTALDPKIAASAVSDDTAAEVLAFLSKHLAHPVVVEAILRLRPVPRQLLMELAVVLDEDMQEILLLRQDAILEEPRILDELETNPALSSYSRRRIKEYHEHLLPREGAPPKSTEELEAEADELTDEDVAVAIEAASTLDASGDTDEMTGLSESQLRGLPIPVRLKLSRGAPKSLRNILIRDTNPMVATSVLKFNPMSDSEIEQIAHNRSVIDGVLDEIGRNRAWIRKYPIVLALVRNPRAPVALAMRLVTRLSVRDLRGLARDRNVANVVRSQAERLYRIKSN